jgi:hypothetical protein
MPFSNFIKSITKCFKCGTGAVNDDLPAPRAVSVELMPIRVPCHLPTTPKPIPELDVSVSTSTSIAMFEHKSVTSMNTLTNSFTTHDTFEDVDLATPTNFAEPPKGRKTKASPFGDEHEVSNSMDISDAIPNNDDQATHASSVYSTTPLVLTNQSRPITPPGTPISMDNGPEVVSEPVTEYAPTTASTGNDYTERAMEYQRGKSSLHPSSSRAMNNHTDLDLSLPSLWLRQR